MSEPIIDGLRGRRLHKQPEVVAAAHRTRTRHRTAEPDPRDPDALIRNYIDRFREIFDAKDPTTKRYGLTALKRMLCQRFVISPDPANFEGYFTSQAQQARDLGVPYQEPTETEKNQRIQSIITEQRNSLDVWVDYLASDESNYPPEQKYIALSSILKMGVYDPDTHTYSKRYKKTYKPFPDLDSEALGTAMTQIESGETEDFSSAYGEALFQVLHQRELLAEQGEQIEGEWRCYQQGSDYQQLMRDTAGKGSGWCFATNAHDARQYVEHGDQWIYYTTGSDGTFSVPRIGISVRNGQIFEARGAAKGQAMEGGGIEDIAMAKLKEFPGYEAYQQRTADTKHLVELKRKKEESTPFTKDDLTFLYEVDRAIESFGRRDEDTRARELLAGRDIRADMLTIFDCTPSQIAHSPEEVMADTKAYVGPLYPDIFIQLRHLDHIYTAFPEEKMRRTRVEIGGKTKEQLIAELEAKNIRVWEWTKQFMSKMTTSTERKELEIVRLTIADLGFPNGCTTTQLFARAKELGLEFCPAELGLHYRLQYMDQPDSEWLSIGMEPIIYLNDSPSVFNLGHHGDGLELSVCVTAGPVDDWNAGNKVAFSLRPPVGEAGKVP